MMVVAIGSIWSPNTRCKSPIGRGALGVRWLGLGAAAMVEERWRLGIRERGEGDGAGREEREMLERERGERDREALRLFFLDSR